MKIGVGSTNQVKVNAVKCLVSLYPVLEGSEIISLDINSGVSDQPKSLEETVRGAKARAEGAFKGNDLGFGIESGLLDVPYSKTGKMNFSACAIYDGKEFHLGLSSAFECPP